MIYRGVDRHSLHKELFGPDICENDLTSSQKAQLLETMDVRATWVVKRNGDWNAIYSKSCETTFKRHKKDPTQTCESCLDLKEVDSVVSAINHKYSDDNKMKFTPTALVLINTHHTLRRKHTEFDILSTSLESSTGGDFGDFLQKLSLMANKGLFQNREAMKGMIMGCSIRAEREEAGKSLRGMRIDEHLNDCRTTLGAMSKSALKIVTKNFVGKTLRCQRMDRAKSKSQIDDVMAQGNFDFAGTIISELGYSGPVTVGSDQTVCVRTLLHHRGFIVGAQGGDITFNGPNELQELLEKIKTENSLCSKVSLYTNNILLLLCPLIHDIYLTARLKFTQCKFLFQIYQL